MIEDPKLTVLSRDGNRSELAKSVDEYEKERPQLERHYAIRAELYKSFYDALIEKGFDADTAARFTESEFLQ